MEKEQIKELKKHFKRIYLNSFLEFFIWIYDSKNIKFNLKNNFEIVINKKKYELTFFQLFDSFAIYENIRISKQKEQVITQQLNN